MKTEGADISQNVSIRTVNRVLNEAGVRTYRAIRAPALSQINRTKRREWCQIYIEKPLEFWATVGVSIETDISQSFYAHIKPVIP